MENQEPKPIRVITEPGAFGQPGYMVIIRTKQGNAAKVDSFAVLAGEDEEQLATIADFKKKAITDPDFLSFTTLRFIEETRPLEEPEAIIHKPTDEDVLRVSGSKRRSKYSPGEN